MSALLEGKRLIVTGTASGIGASALKALVAEGAEVAALDVQDKQGLEVAAAANGGGASGHAYYFHCDVAKRGETFAVFKTAVARMGGLDGLLHIAALERTAPAEEIDDAQWDLLFEVNARGTMITNQAAFPYLRERGGRIVNFGSAAGVTGMPGGAAYAASKGAVLAWTRTVAFEWARYNITVNAVAPGMWTPMYDAHRAKLGANELAQLDQIMAMRIPLGGKLGNPDTDMSPVLVFLMSDGARFITAQTLPVDGGMLVLT